MFTVSYIFTPRERTPARELTQCYFICRATSRARAALMDRNYAEFELINEELHNLSTAAYFTKACKCTPTIPYPHSPIPYHTLYHLTCKYTLLPTLPYTTQICKYTPSQIGGSTVLCPIYFSAVRVEAGRPWDRVGRAVCRRERDEHRADDVPDAGLRGARAPADLTRPHDRRHHALPRPLHIGTWLSSSRTVEPLFYGHCIGRLFYIVENSGHW